MKPSVVLPVALAALVAASVYVWLDVRQEREFRRLIAVGDAAAAEGQTFLAIESFSGAIVLKGGAMLPYLKRGDTYRRRGDFEAALRDLRRAATLDATAPQPIELLGDVHAALGEHGEAARHYQRYLALEDRAAGVLYKLAVARFRNGEPEAAVEPLRRAVSLDPQFAEAHHLLALSLRAANRPDDARVSLLRAVALDAAFTGAREELADLAEQQAERRDEIDQLEALAALEPSRPERLIDVGLAYARTGRTEAAIVTLGRAAERYPDSAAVYTALGRVWIGIAEPRRDPVALSKAIEALQDVAGRPDASGETLTLYGRALLLSGQAALAERTLQTAVTRLPVDPLAFAYLAEAGTRLGHADVARDAAARYQALTGP